MDFKILIKACDRIINTFFYNEKITILSGKARGADLLGERYAKLKKYEIEEYPADWERFGKSAGYIRNEQMALNGDVLIAFWDMKSKGTQHMINLAKKHNLKIFIIDYQNRKILKDYV